MGSLMRRVHSLPFVVMTIVNFNRLLVFLNQSVSYALFVCVSEA